VKARPGPSAIYVRVSIIGALVSLAAVGPAVGQRYEVASPDGAIRMTVAVGERVTYTLRRDNDVLIAASPISMTTRANDTLGEAPTVAEVHRRSVDRTLRPVAPAKNATVPDRFNELTVDFEKRFSLVFRVYDDGAAHRFETRFRDSLTVEDETTVFRLAGGGSPAVYMGKEEDFITHSESYYQPPVPADSLDGRMSTVPVVARYGDEGPRVAITEVGLRDYAGMFVKGADADGTLRGVFPKVALDEAVRGDDERNTYPARRAGFIARTAGERAFPWRAVLIAESDKGLLENQLVYKLAPERRLNETGWIEPGKVAWDWYNARNLFDVDFKAGVNTRTYKYYIDFAARHDLKYVILDEGWYELGDLLQVVEAIDMEELTRYAEKKDVGLILWMVWKTLDRQMQEALDQFEEWGVSGLKIDFMQRDDQEVVNFYWRTAREAAERELLVNFHGNYKPTGLRRAYPNVLTREGVKGLENTKWSDGITPEHNVTIPFTRMVAGPMDYTPGAMVNAHPKHFAARFERPMSQGTRAHQLAMYVVYESPMQMLADSPSHYMRAPEAMRFLAPVPVVWDETRALRAKIGDYVAVARRSGSEWYVGAMTDGQARHLDLDLSFLGEGTYRAEMFRDGPNADRYAEDLQSETREVTAGDRLRVEMVRGGGFAARIYPAQ
jgi:alpha-glucosidase